MQDWVEHVGVALPGLFLSFHHVEDETLDPHDEAAIFCMSGLIPLCEVLCTLNESVSIVADGVSSHVSMPVLRRDGLLLDVIVRGVTFQLREPHGVDSLGDKCFPIYYPQVTVAHELPRCWDRCFKQASPFLLQSLTSHSLMYGGLPEDVVCFLSNTHEFLGLVHARLAVDPYVSRAGPRNCSNEATQFAPGRAADGVLEHDHVFDTVIFLPAFTMTFFDWSRISGETFWMRFPGGCRGDAEVVVGGIEVATAGVGVDVFWHCFECKIRFRDAAYLSLLECVQADGFLLVVIVSAVLDVTNSPDPEFFPHPRSSHCSWVASMRVPQ